MQHPFLDLLSTPLIPELSTDIAAGPSRNIHLVLIRITAVRTPPDQLTVCIRYNFDFPMVIARLTVIALGI